MSGQQDHPGVDAETRFGYRVGLVRPDALQPPSSIGDPSQSAQLSRPSKLHWRRIVRTTIDPISSRRSYILSVHEGCIAIGVGIRAGLRTECCVYARPEPFLQLCDIDYCLD